jgi:GTPase SAR1 family protein
MAPTPHAQSQEPINVKLVIIGDPGVGKTSLERRFFGDGWSPNVSVTIGASFRVRSQFSRLSLFKFFY